MTPGTGFDKTLLIVDDSVSVGGMAGGMLDLSSLGAHGIEVERISQPVAGLSKAALARLSRKHPAGLVAIGLSADARELDSEALASVVGANPGRSVLILGMHRREGGPLLPARNRILSHVLVPADLSVRSGCTAACLERVARQKARKVTLAHVPNAVTSHRCTTPAGVLNGVDMDWVETLKNRLLAAGVAEVEFLAPAVAEVGAPGLASGVSLVLLGGACDTGSALRYWSSARDLLLSSGEMPAIMLTPDRCSVSGASAGAA